MLNKINIKVPGKNMPLRNMVASLNILFGILLSHFSPFVNRRYGIVIIFCAEIPMPGGKGITVYLVKVFDNARQVKPSITI